MDIGLSSQSIPNFITPEQLAKLFGVSKQTVYRLVEKRTLPFYKIGGSLRFKIDEVLGYVEMRRIKPSNELYEHTQKRK